MTQRRIYQEEYPYFITFRTRENYPLFDDEKMAGLLSEIIFNAGRMKRYDILAYQIMPDHVHVLVYRLDGNAGGVQNAIAGAETRDVGVDACCPPKHRTRVSPPAVASTSTRASATVHTLPTISDLMYTIKSYFIKQIRTSHDIPYSIWHTRFYARIVNNRRYLRTVIEYIKRNPTKAELPGKYHKMPHQYLSTKELEQL